MACCSGSTPASRWSARSTASSRCSRRCSSRPAATSPSGSPTCARVRDRVVAAAMGLPAPGVPALDAAVGDRRQGPRPRRHGRARPGQRARHRHRARRPHRPHGDHRRAARACRASCGSPARRRSRTVPTWPSTPPTARSPLDPSEEPACRAGAAGARRADAGVGHRPRRHGRRPRGRAAGQHRHRRGRRARRRWWRRGRRPVPHRGAVPGEHDGADAGGPGRRRTRGCCAAFGDRKVVVRTLDAGADKPLAFATQPDEENPALGVRGYRLVRTHPELLDTQLEALAHAQAATGTTPVGHGADDRDRRRGAGVRHAGPAPPASPRSA